MLKEGDILSLEDGREVPVQSIETITYNHYVNVYNFEVEDYHTYYVSGISVLVHNKCNKEIRKFSTIKDVTKKGSIKNIETNVTMKEFCVTLETNGLKKYFQRWKSFDFYKGREQVYCKKIFKINRRSNSRVL